MNALTAQNHIDAGVAFLQRNDFANANSFFEEAARLDPLSLAAYTNIAACCIRTDDMDRAMWALDTALKIDPTDAHLLCQYGAVEIHRHELRNAAQRLNQATLYNAELPEIHINFGYLYQLMGDYQKARQAYERALMIEPGNMEVRGWYGMVLLSLGQWRTGLNQYECRLGFQSPLRNGIPAWDGTPLHGKTIVVYSEQGSGDCIQMVRYIDSLKKNWGAARVIFACPTEMGALVSGQTCAEVICNLAIIPPHDCQVAMMSLPLHMDRNQVDPAVEFPYLESPLSSEFEWPDLDCAHNPDALNIGFSFSGSAKHRNDKYRSIPARQFAQLLEQSRGANWWMLQLGDLPKEFDGLAKRLHTPTLVDLASAVDRMDLIVSVDTCIVHLAGAMNVPVLAMLPANADWRWTLEGAKTVWYPSVQLFRQQTLQDWEPVFSDVLNAIAEIHQGLVGE